MWIDDLEATIDKDRIGTHWEGCYLEHNDCAILRLIDYAVQLERENIALSSHNRRLVAGLEQDAKRHPVYGPCDGFDNGACSECNRMFEALQRDNDALSVNAENLEIVRKQRNEGANLARAYMYAYEDALNGWVDSVKETDEARDIACKLLALAKTLWRARFPIRDMAAVEWMNLPEWLRREIEG